MAGRGGAALVPTTISYALKTTNDSTTNAASYATGSYTPAAGALDLVWVFNSKATTPDVPTLSGNGMTYGQVATVEVGAALRVTLFSAVGSGTAGAITIDFAGAVQTGVGWVIAELTSTAGTPSVVQSKTGSDASSVTSAAITLDNAVGGTSTAYATFGAFIKATTLTFTLGGGFSSVANAGYATPTVQYLVERDIGPTDNVVDATWATASAWAGVAVEFAGGLG